MANQILDQLFTILQNLRTHATNLNKDLDERDQREETKGDLARLFGSFNELKTVMVQLEQSDIAKLQDELKQLLSGEENILEYNRDVSNILLEARKRAEKNEPTKEKVTENLPTQQKNQNVGNVFDNWRSILANVQHWIEQNSKNKIGSR
jgi:hypothetical protein